MDRTHFPIFYKWMKQKGFQVLCLIKIERESSINISLAMKWISFISINKDACLHNMLLLKDFTKSPLYRNSFPECSLLLWFRIDSKGQFRIPMVSSFSGDWSERRNNFCVLLSKMSLKRQKFYMENVFKFFESFIAQNQPLSSDF